MRPYYDAGGVTLYHGEALSVLADLPTASADALICDPPYSSGGQYRGDRTQSTGTKYVQSETLRGGGVVGHHDFTGDNRDQRGFAYWCALWLSEAHRVLVPGSPAAIFSDWRQLPTATDALQAGGFVWRGIVAWDKTPKCRPSLGRFAAQAEFLAWGSAGPMPVERGVGTLPGVFTIPIDSHGKHHQTGKPTALMRAIVEIAITGGTVLDPFAGSGTTLVAAKSLGRKAIGVEIDERYCETTARRLDQEGLPVFAEPPRDPVQSGMFTTQPGAEPKAGG